METITTKVAEYSKAEAALAELRQIVAASKFDVTTKEGMAGAKKLRHQLRTLRTTLEDKRKEIKAPILVQGKLIDDEAKRITAEIVTLEDPIDAQITAVEKAEAEKKAAAEKADQERRNGILQRIADMEKLPVAMVGQSVVELAATVDEHVENNPAQWAQEFLPQARQAHLAVAEKLRQMHGAAVAAEAEVKRQAEERKKLDADRAELEREQAEQRAAGEKAKAAREADERAVKERAERTQMALSEITGIRQQAIIAQIGRAGVRVGGTVQCIEETLAETEAWPVTWDNFGEYTAVAATAKAETVAQIKALLAATKAQSAKEAELRAQQEKLDAERRAKEEAEHQEKLAKEREAEALARAERDRIAAEEEAQRQEKLAAAELERQAWEKKEAAERERRRQDAERMDARQHLEAFVEQYGHLQEYGFVVVAIRTYLEKNPARKAA